MIAYLRQGWRHLVNTFEKHRQAWCNWQVKLCYPCLSAEGHGAIKMHVYIYFLVLSCMTVSLLCYCTHCVMSMMNTAVFVVFVCLFDYN